MVLLTSCIGTEGEALCVKEGEVAEESFHSPSLKEDPFEEWNVLFLVLIRRLMMVSLSP